MLNRIVITEKDQITTLKVVDELRHVDIQQEMRLIEKNLVATNSQKITLDLDNLQVLSNDTHEILGLIIKYVRLQNIPISITGSTKLPPGNLLAISEGRPQLIEQMEEKDEKEEKEEKETFSIKPKYFSRYSTPFFSSENDDAVFGKVITVIANNSSDQDEAETPFQDNKPEEVEIVYGEEVSEKYSYWFLIGWGLLFGLTGVALTLVILLWPDFQSGKVHEVFRPVKKSFLVEMNDSVDVPFVKDKLKSSLIQAVKDGDETSVKSFLVAGADLERKDQNGYTALLHAVKKHNPQLVKLLTEHGANVGVTDEFEDTPLIWAASINNTEIVKILLEHDADSDQGNFTPLMWAAYHDNLPMLNLFLQKRANLNARTNEGWTALMWAAEKGNSLSMWELLKRGARVNIQNNNGKTALILAARQGKIGTIGLLLNKGADQDIVDFDKKTALDHAKDFQHQDVLHLLEKQIDLQ